MNIQSTITGTNFNYNNSLVIVENSESASVSTTASLPDKNDSVEISPQTIALSKALSSVEKELATAKNQGYPVPPPCITNDKQINIIKKMITGKLSAPVDDATISKAAEVLWKNAGYRLDTAPIPRNTNGSGNGYDFMTKSDRQEMDKVYDEAEASGLDAVRITNDKAAEITKQRMKEVDIANGAVYGDESDIIPLSAEDLAKLAEEERIKQSQPKKSESLDTLQKSLSTIKKSLHLNELLLSFLQKNNNQIP
jgi:hypothetical protein